MADVEPTLNTHLAILLDGMRHNWTVKTEQTRVMKRLARIDMLVAECGWPQVIVECKFWPKPEDVSKRFDKRFEDDGAVPSERTMMPGAAVSGQRKSRSDRLSYSNRVLLMEGLPCLV